MLASYQQHAKLRMPAFVTTMAAPLVIWGESRIHDINASTIAHAIDELPRAFDTVDHVMHRFGERPAAQLAYRLVPGYDGNLPAGVLP